MEWVETTGRTVDAALDAALDELGVDEDDVEFEVVAEPKSGFLGLGGSDARIRARVKPISREKPGERQRRRGRKDTRNRNGGNGGGRSDKRPSGKPKDEARVTTTRSPATAADSGSGRSSGDSRSAGRPPGPPHDERRWHRGRNRRQAPPPRRPGPWGLRWRRSVRRRQRRRDRRGRRRHR